MQDLDDIALLREYTDRGSEAAFAAIVARHVNKVYSVALRKTGNPSHAEEITQAVFVILAKKSSRLRGTVILSSWLYETARLTSITFLRSEIRRARREQEAFMQSSPNETESDLWRQIAPLVEDAMARLNERDRHAVTLRFFDGKNMSEVGAALGVNEDAAKKRVGRALAKLRGFFASRGVSSTTVLIAGAISANSVQPAPIDLAGIVSAVAVAKGAAASASTLTLTKGALKFMAWTQMKTAVVAGAVLLLGAGAIIVKNDFFPSEPSYQGRPLSKWLADADFGQPQAKRANAYEAIRKMGTGTLPFLIADLTPGRKGNENNDRQAAWGFDALGPIAKPAIPKLTSLLGENPGCVAPALASIGPDALPVILSSLTNGSFWVRDNMAAGLANAIFSEKITPEQASAAFPIALSNLSYKSTNSLYQANTRSRAAWLLAALKLHPDLTIPALRQGLQDSNVNFASDCAFALSQFHGEARLAIPELLEASNSTNRLLSITAKQSLETIEKAQ